MSQSLKYVIEARDVTEEILEIAYDISDSWYPEGKIYWEGFITRLESAIEGSDFGDSMLSSAIKKIQREVNRHRRENGI